MTYISIFQLLSLLCVGLLFGGVLNLLLGDGTNNCEMTYMYEYPQFVRIKVTGNGRFPQYGLYSYSEGRLTERARKMRFDGIPVLFLPGNSGSHHQVRSLASVALRKALSSQLDLHFDYFTVDFNEEISGLYGGVLETQTEFALMSLKTVLELYNNRQNSKPQSVILIGHSIGGVIAKGIAANEAASNMTKLIITIASPTMVPVVNLDPLINKYYMQLNANWQTKQIVKSKVLVNIGSGFRDILVPSGLTLSSDSDVHALTTAIPGVWMSNDHLSITWCRQLILVINRFLFSIVDRTTEQISDNKQYILNQARIYFKENNSLTVNTTESAEEPIHFDAFWYEDSRRMYQISRPQITKLTYLMIRLVNFPQNRFVAIRATNLEDKIWVYGCNAGYTDASQRICKTAAPLSELSKWVPAPKGSPKAKIALIHLHNIMEQKSNWTHIIVKVSPTREPVKLDIDTNDKESRTITVPTPSFYNFGKTLVKSETEVDAMYYELVIPGFEMLYQTLLLYVEPMNKCAASSKFHVTAEMQVPWASGHEVYYMFTPAEPGPMRLRLFKNKPTSSRNSSGNHVSVRLLLDTQCTYKISISNSHYDTLGQVTRNYVTLLVPYLVAVLLLMARQNLMDLSAEEDARCKSFHSVLCSDSLKPYYILVTGRLGNVAFGSIPLLGYILANAGSHVGTVYTTGGTLLPLPIYLTALGLAQIAGAAVIGSIVCASQVAHRLVLRVIWRGRSGSLAEKATSALRRVPSVVAVLLVATVPTSCGAAALAVGGAFYFFMLSKMYEEYLEDFVYKILAKVLCKIKTYFKTHTKNNPQKQSTDLAVSAPSDTSHNDNTDKNCGISLQAIEDKPEDSETLPLLSEVKKSLNESSEDGRDISECGGKGKGILLKSIEDNKSDNESTLVKSDNSNAPGDKNETLLKADNSEVSTKQVDVNTIEVKDENVDKLSGLNFHFFMFCLWALVTFINLPALLTWARNFKYGMVLQSDVSLYPGIVLSISAGFLWQIEAPRKRLKHYELMSQIIFVVAVLTLMLAPSAMFYLNYIIPTVFALITFQQFLDKEMTLPSCNIVNDEDCGREGAQIPETRPNENEDSNFDSFQEFKEKFDKFTAED